MQRLLSRFRSALLTHKSNRLLGRFFQSPLADPKQMPFLYDAAAKLALPRMAGCLRSRRA